MMMHSERGSDKLFMNRCVLPSMDADLATRIDARFRQWMLTL